MTAPSSNPPASKVKRIADEQPVFPCWLCCPRDGWDRLNGPFKVSYLKEAGYTHWHEDQPEAPAEIPSDPASLAPTKEDMILEKAMILDWLHTGGGPSFDGWEYGVMRVKYNQYGQQTAAEWTLSDSSDVIEAMRHDLTGFPAGLPREQRPKSPTTPASVVSGTPRTDADARYVESSITKNSSHLLVTARLARTLEQELIVARQAHQRCENSVVEASIEFPNVGDYIKQVEAQLAALTAERDRAENTARELLCEHGAKEAALQQQVDAKAKAHAELLERSNANWNKLVALTVERDDFKAAHAKELTLRIESDSALSAATRQIEELKALNKPAAGLAAAGAESEQRAHDANEQLTAALSLVEAAIKDRKLLAELAEIIGASIKLGVQAFDREAGRRLVQMQAMLREYWDAQNAREDSTLTLPADQPKQEGERK